MGLVNRVIPDDKLLAEVGGKLDIETQRNHGFVLQASLPMEHAV